MKINKINSVVTFGALILCLCLDASSAEPVSDQPAYMIERSSRAGFQSVPYDRSSLPPVLVEAIEALAADNDQPSIKRIKLDSAAIESQDEQPTMVTPTFEGNFIMLGFSPLPGDYPAPSEHSAKFLKSVKKRTGKFSLKSAGRN